MPKKECCCPGSNCCDDIFYSNFIILAGETLDDAAPVNPNDIIILTMNRPGAGSGPATTVFPTSCGNTNCTCLNCSWIRANFCSKKGTESGLCGCSEENNSCEEEWNDEYAECGPYPGPKKP